MICLNLLRRLLLSSALILMTWLPVPLVAQDVICIVPAVHAKIVAKDGGYNLVVMVINSGATNVSFEPFYLEENMLHLKGVEVSGGRVLKQLVPLLNPGVGQIILGPKEKYVRTVSLNTYFPELKSAIAESDVRITWEVSVQGGNSCAAQTLAARMLIPQEKKGGGLATKGGRE